MRDLQPHHTQWEKIKIFPTKIRNMTRLSTFTICIQHSIGSPSHSNQIGKGNKRHPNWKEETKLLLFADDMIVYIENPIDSTKKLLDLINDFGETGGYKVNTQKSKAFLYTNKETSETEIRNKIPFDIATRKIKYLGINLTKEVETCTQKTIKH